MIINPWPFLAWFSKLKWKSRPKPPAIQLSKHILIVEDNRLDQELLYGTLRILGHTWEIVPTIRGAKTLLNSNAKFDAICIDCRVPNGISIHQGGVELANYIISSGRFDSLMICMICTQAEDLAGLLSAAMVMLLIKPAMPDQVKRMLGKI